MKKNLILAAIVLFAFNAFAQEDDDLLKLVGEDEPKKEFVYNAFKSSRVIMSHSMEMLRPGVLDFRILHRFGNLNSGISQFFGLDQATIRLGLDYAVSNHLTVGIGRSSHKKELDGFLKYRVLQQATGPKSLPFSLVAVAGSSINTLPWAEPDRMNYFSSRMAYWGQLIIGRKFSESFTLQIVPTIVHRNLVETFNDDNDIYTAGIGGRIKLTKRISLNFDYYYVVNLNPDRNLLHPLSIGFDIETGGHVFQLHFTNAMGMNERAFITETINNWGKGDVQFGFNISRSFQIKKKKT